jgi:hypothetical protein
MWEAYQATLKEHLKTESWADWFQENRHVFSTALGEQVDDTLAEIAAEGPAVSPRHLVSPPP